MEFPVDIQSVACAAAPHYRLLPEEGGRLEWYAVSAPLDGAVGHVLHRREDGRTIFWTLDPQHARSFAERTSHIRNLEVQLGDEVYFRSRAA